MTITSTGAFTFKDVDVSTYTGNTSKYKTISGTLTHATTSLAGDFTFTGGPVVKLKYTYATGSKSFTINADNKDLTYASKDL